MSDKRIIQLTETQTIAADDYVPVDGATGGTKKFLASNLGGKAEVMTEAEWDDLPDSKLTDGKVYALSGVSPSTQDNPLWQKLGFAALDTQADDCSDAINELNTGLTTLNSNLTTVQSKLGNAKIYTFFNSDTFTVDLGFTPDGSRAGNAIFFNANQAHFVLLRLDTAPTATVIYGSRTFTVSGSGSVFTITSSSKMWGTSTIILDTN